MIELKNKILFSTKFYSYSYPKQHPEKIFMLIRNSFLFESYLIDLNEEEEEEKKEEKNSDE